MTELIWDGKYDKDGRRVAPLQVALPFQTVETVNESAQERQRTLDLFTKGGLQRWMGGCSENSTLPLCGRIGRVGVS
jgi:hypothetical protein